MLNQIPRKPTQSVKASCQSSKSSTESCGKLQSLRAVAAKAPATKAILPELERKAKADEAVKAALATSKKMKEAEEPSEDEEFDAEAFFAASGGQGLFQAHVMRKERVDVNIDIRFRIIKKVLLFTTLNSLTCQKRDYVFAQKRSLKIKQF